MSRAEGGASGITIEQLAALNEEIAALVRAGVPLERGLMRAGDELPGRLGSITTRLGERMSRGESLAEAVDGERSTLPPLYRAVVQAGARSGELGAALEGLSRFVRGYGEARGVIGLALWYPILVLTLAYGLFVAIAMFVVPRFIAAFESLRLPIVAPLRWLEQIGELAPYWWPAWPVLLVLLLIGWWRSGRSAHFESGAWSILKFFPWMKSLLSDYQAAGFAELLALLIDHRVALPEAVVLAADASGDPAMARGAGVLAGAIGRGESPASVLGRTDVRSFRPLLRWVLGAGATQGSLADSLRNLSIMYRKRAAHQAEKLRLFAPAMLMILIGATATLVYALTLFVPLASMLEELSWP